jgi:hypothetical protein
MTNDKAPNLLLNILIINLIVTSLHYTDNAVFISKYPQPDWITVTGIYLTWIVLSSIGLIGYWLYRQQKFKLSLIFLGIYSLTGLSSFAHYFYGNLSEFSTKMHLFICLDVAVGMMLLGWIVWCSLRLKPWQKMSNLH